MIYKKSGRKSRAWWLQSIQTHGKTSKAKMAAAIHVAQADVTWALRDLISEHYVRLLGADGKGKRPQFELTELGEGYLRRNQEELGEQPAVAAADKPAVVYTWKRVLGGGVKYYADGQHIAAALVPEAELARIRQELGAGKFGSDVEHQAEAEYHDGDVYTWKKPVVGPTQYFLNGEFTLETKVPKDEMNRMLAEQGSPLLGTDQGSSYRVKVLDNGERHYFLNDQMIPRSEVPESQLEFLDNWTPPKEGDPRLKKSRIPKHLLDETEDDLDESLDQPPEPKVANSTPLEKPAPIKETPRINKPTPVSDPPKPPQSQIDDDKETPTPPPTGIPHFEDYSGESQLPPPSPESIASRQRDIFRVNYEAVLIEVLLERYAHLITAKEIYDRLQEQHHD